MRHRANAIGARAAVRTRGRGPTPPPVPTPTMDERALRPRAELDAWTRQKALLLAEEKAPRHG